MELIKNSSISGIPIINNCNWENPNLSKREVFAEWVADLRPNFKFTFTFPEDDKSISFANQKVKSFFNLMHRKLYGRACVRAFKKRSDSLDEVAGMLFFEQHAAGGYHIHGFLWEPRNPNRDYDFQTLAIRCWEKVAKSQQNEVKRTDYNDSKDYARYCTKTFGYQFDHDDRWETKYWGSID